MRLKPIFEPKFSILLAYRETGSIDIQLFMGFWEAIPRLINVIAVPSQYHQCTIFIPLDAIYGYFNAVEIKQYVKERYPVQRLEWVLVVRHISQADCKA